MTATSTGLPIAQITRPRTVLVATMFASIASFMVFVGVVLVYVRARSTSADWFDSGSIELGPSGFILATLILSIFTIQWAVQAINNEDRTNAYVALAITALFGAAVFNQLWFIINDTGFVLNGSTAEFLYFLVNGTFAVFMIASTALVTLTFLRALIGQFGPKKADGVAAAAFYWNTVVFMWAIAWYVIYVTK